MLLRYFTYFFIIFGVSAIVKADESEEQVKSMGEFANDLSKPVDFLHHFISTGALILGVVCFFMGIMKYLEYRQNPYSASLSSVLSLVLPAIALVSLPFLTFILGVEVDPLQK
jgi:ABC-type uncharacterized transport system permease subunit